MSRKSFFGKSSFRFLNLPYLFVAILLFGGVVWYSYPAEAATTYTANLNVIQNAIEGTTNIEYMITITPTNASGVPITFDSAFTGGSTVAGTDFTDVSGTGTFTINNNKSASALSVSVIDDMEVEGDETAELTISNSSGGDTTIAASSAIATITDNDSAGEFSATATIAQTTDGIDYVNTSGPATVSISDGSTCVTEDELKDFLNDR